MRYKVILSSYNGEKIRTIKAVRGITGLGLKEAKDLVELAESRPGGRPGGEVVVLDAVTEELAQEAVCVLLEAGAAARIEGDRAVSERDRATEICRVLTEAYAGTDVSAEFALRKASALIQSGWNVRNT